MMGNGPFAVPTLRRLLEVGHEIPLVVVRPERGKPGRVPPSPVRVAAEELGLPVAAPESVNTDEGRDILAAASADLLVVCDFGQILSRATLAITALGGINLHGSLLPKFRGAAPVQWAVLSGEPVTGVSVIHMTPRLDGGPILTRRETPIGPEETAGDLETRLSEVGVPAVLEAIEQLASWNGQDDLGQSQDPTDVTQAPRLAKHDGKIDWSRSTRDLDCHVRGMNPWPRAFTDWTKADGTTLRLIVESAVPGDPSVLSDDSAAPNSDLIPSDTVAPGTVAAARGELVFVRTGDGVLQLCQVQPAGKRVMTAGEFLRGYGVRAGVRLGDV